MINSSLELKFILIELFVWGRGDKHTISISTFSNDDTEYQVPRLCAAHCIG